MSDRILTGEEIRSAILPLLKKFRAEKAVLFGSYARNGADGKSDIDILIIGGEHFAPTDVFCIADELYRSLAKNVDVYDISEIDVDSELYENIISEGIEITPEKRESTRMQQSDAIKISNEAYHLCSKVLPCEIQDAYLYGSYARGDFNRESDVDIFLTVDLDPSELAVYRTRISEISSDMSLAHDVTVSITVKPLEQFRRYSDILPYYKNVLREGIRCAG